MILHEKEYYDDTLILLESDVFDKIATTDLPTDEYGFILGKFIVQIVFKEDFQEEN